MSFSSSFKLENKKNWLYFYTKIRKKIKKTCPKGVCKVIRQQ